jgi:hypothetical protein
MTKVRVIDRSQLYMKHPFFVLAVQGIEIVALLKFVFKDLNCSQIVEGKISIPCGATGFGETHLLPANQHHLIS